MLHNKNIRTAKTETWFKETKKDSTDKNHNSSTITQLNQHKTNKQEKQISKPQETNQNNKITRNRQSINFQQELINHRDQFVRIIAHHNQQLDSFQGILARIEVDFITLIDTPTIIKIPIKKITAVITNPNKLPASNLSPKQIKPIIKEIIDILFDLDTEV